MAAEQGPGSSGYRQGGREGGLVGLCSGSPWHWPLGKSNSASPSPTLAREPAAASSPCLAPASGHLTPLVSALPTVGRLQLQNPRKLSPPPARCSEPWSLRSCSEPEQTAAEPTCPRTRQVSSAGQNSPPALPRTPGILGPGQLPGQPHRLWRVTDQGLNHHPAPYWPCELGRVIVPL